MIKQNKEILTGKDIALILITAIFIFIIFKIIVSIPQIIKGQVEEACCKEINAKLEIGMCCYDASCEECGFENQDYCLFLNGSKIRVLDLNCSIKNAIESNENG